MKLLKQDSGQYSLHLAAAESDALRVLLALYPVVDAGHHDARPSGAGAGTMKSNPLLAEALAAHRAESRRQLESWLSSPDRFIRLPGSAEECRLDFNAEELEWLLQILNDIRVGSWVRLGAPDLDMVKPEVTPDNLRYAWALDVSGCFQAALLRAIE